jgi:hypothetical protein
MCELCHSEIYELYKQSVHGAALIGEGNPDVPGCIDCHQVHSTAGPSTSPFHLFSPQVCAECHADPELMQKYGISTEVFDTYVDDFHGTTVTLFQKLTPDQKTDKPVCIDCHGVHDMRQVDDPESTVIKENALTTCKNAIPRRGQHHLLDQPLSSEPATAALVYFVNLFIPLYPILLGGMAHVVPMPVTNY